MAAMGGCTFVNRISNRAAREDAAVVLQEGGGGVLQSERKWEEMEGSTQGGVQGTKETGRQEQMGQHGR